MINHRKNNSGVCSSTNNKRNRATCTLSHLTQVDSDVMRYSYAAWILVDFEITAAM